MNEQEIQHIALAGNPNCGKSTIFNALTGLRQKVANYPGVTVEKKEGVMKLDDGKEIHIIDLPGTYSLNPRSLDEEVAHDIVLGLRQDTPSPSVIVSVLDASNLERNLFFASQLLSTGKPMVVALNMMDLARGAGTTIDVGRLSSALGVPVIAMSANRGQGLTELKTAIIEQLRSPQKNPDVLTLPETVKKHMGSVIKCLIAHGLANEASATGEALRLVSSEKMLEHGRFSAASPELGGIVKSVRENLQKEGIHWHALEANYRYEWIENVMDRVCKRREVPESVNDKLDRILTHRVLGPVMLMAIMLFIFISIFNFAQYPMDAIKGFFDFATKAIESHMAEGPLQNLITAGVISGVSSVLVFLPQILLLFFFIAILEDTGYMSRAAFIMDRVMGKVGLHGKAFIPLLSSFACAIPGVMSARTIENAKDRLVTILVAPLMCCSARWPVYFLLAGAFIPHRQILGFIPLPALVIFSMVLFGVIAAVTVAGIFKRTIIKGETPTLILELPPYRVPSFKTIFRVMLDRGWIFIKNAGTIILAISIVLWALASYPKHPDVSADQQIQNSFAGKLGRSIEPIIKPLGFDWKIGISIITSFAAREVFVSSMGTIYGIEVSDTHETKDLQTRLQKEIDPETGTPFFTPLRAISLMVFYVLAMQCMSTMAAVKRETNSWNWTIFQWAYMTGLAWLASFAVWQGGHLLGYH